MKFPSIIVTAVPLLLTSLAAVPAGAARVAVLAPEARGSGAAKLSRATHARLLRLLSSESIEAVTPSRKQAAALRRCAPGRRAACLRAARPLKADLVLISRLARRGKRLQVTLRLLSVERATLAGSTVVLEPAGAAGVARVAAAALALVAAQQRAPSSASARAAASPAPAEVPLAAAVRAQAVDGETPR